MYNLKDILIVGDSFASCRTLQTDWPKIVTDHLIKYTEYIQPMGKGFAGASWWSVKRFLNDYLKTHTPKVLILTHTECQRIPSNENYSLNYGSVFNAESYHKLKKQERDDEIPPYEVLIAGQSYYKYLYNQDFHQWAKIQWFKELDELIKDIPVVIHLHVFYDENKFLYTFKNGLTFNKPLWGMSDDCKKLTNKMSTLTDSIQVVPENIWKDLQTRNHLTEENNKKLASIIIDAIENYSVGPRDIQL